jgi:hypothetical protein
MELLGVEATTYSVTTKPVEAEAGMGAQPVEIAIQRVEEALPITMEWMPTKIQVRAHSLEMDMSNTSFDRSDVFYVFYVVLGYEIESFKDIWGDYSGGL